MARKTLSDSQRDEAAQLVAWFSVLVHSWYIHDLSEAGRANDELDRLGFRVKITRPRRTITQLSKIEQISRVRVRELIRQGTLEAYDINHGTGRTSLRITQQALDDFRERSKVPVCRKQSRARSPPKQWV